VVTDPAVTEDQRFPMLAVIPLTGTPGEGALYPALRPGESGLHKPSWALIDQLRTIDKRRVNRVFGIISTDELAVIDDGMRLFLGLGTAATMR
jgi:mRNA interferase MazF